MPTKQEVLKSIEDRTYYGKEVRHLITSISQCSYNEDKISSVRKGDVFIHTGVAKHRPYVVIKVLKGTSLCLGLSTTKNFMNLGTYNCRQFGNGFINMSMSLLTNDYIKKHFVGVMSDRKGLNESIKLLKYLTDKV